MFKKIKKVLKENKDLSLLSTDLKKIKGNANYLNYISDFRQHFLDPKEDIEERMNDIINYLRNSKEIISRIGEKKIKNGSVVLVDNSPIVKEILNKSINKSNKKINSSNLKKSLIEKADIILVGKNINSNIFEIAKKHEVPIFLCAPSLNLKKKKKIYNNFTGIISELGIYKPNVFAEEIKG